MNILAWNEHFLLFKTGGYSTQQLKVRGQNSNRRVKQRAKTMAQRLRVMLRYARLSKWFEIFVITQNHFIGYMPLINNCVWSIWRPCRSRGNLATFIWLSDRLQVETFSLDFHPTTSWVYAYKIKDCDLERSFPLGKSLFRAITIQGKMFFLIEKKLESLAWQDLGLEHFRWQCDTYSPVWTFKKYVPRSAQWFTSSIFLWTEKKTEEKRTSQTQKENRTWKQTAVDLTKILSESITQKKLCLTLSQSRFRATNPKGWGHIVTLPFCENPVAPLRIYSSKVFLKACPKVSLVTPLRFTWKPWARYEGGSQVWDFWLGISIKKSKTLFPMFKVDKLNFFWKLVKIQIEWHLREYRLLSEDLNKSLLLIPFSLLTFVPTYLPRSS